MMLLCPPRASPSGERVRGGADALARERADARASEALRRAFAAPPDDVPGFLSDEEVAPRLTLELREFVF